MGISTATIPDVCKTPSPAGPVSVLYPNIANSITLSSGTSTVKGDKAMAANTGSKFALSNGDNAGVAGGVKSSTFMKEATWILYSFDVKTDGKNPRPDGGLEAGAFQERAFLVEVCRKVAGSPFAIVAMDRRHHRVEGMDALLLVGVADRSEPAGAVFRC